MRFNKGIKLFLLILVVLAIPAAVWLVIDSDLTTLGVKAGHAEEALVFLMPAEARFTQGETVELAVKIDTGKEAVGGCRILVNFTDEFIELAEEPRLGVVFPGLRVRKEAGRLIFEGSGRLWGQGTVAVLVFKAKKTGLAMVEIDRESIVWDEEKRFNLLKNVAGTKIEVE